MIAISDGVAWRPRPATAVPVLAELAATARPVPGVEPWPPDGGAETDLTAAPADVVASVEDDCADAVQHVFAKGPARFADVGAFLDVVLDLSRLQWLLRIDSRIEERGPDRATPEFVLVNAAATLRDTAPALAARVLGARRDTAALAPSGRLDEPARRTVAAAVRAAAARAAAACAGDPRSSAVPTAAADLVGVLSRR